MMYLLALPISLAFGRFSPFYLLLKDLDVLFSPHHSDSNCRILAGLITRTTQHGPPMLPQDLLDPFHILLPDLMFLEEDGLRLALEQGLHVVFEASDVDTLEHQVIGLIPITRPFLVYDTSVIFNTTYDCIPFLVFLGCI